MGYKHDLGLIYNTQHLVADPLHAIQSTATLNRPICNIMLQINVQKPLTIVLDTMPSEHTFGFQVSTHKGPLFTF